MFSIPTESSALEMNFWGLELRVRYDLQSKATVHTTIKFRYTILCMFEVAITWKLWPPEVYQAFGTQLKIRGDSAGCVSGGTCVGVVYVQVCQDVGEVVYRLVFFFMFTYTKYISRPHILKQVCYNWWVTTLNIHCKLSCTPFSTYSVVWM